MKKFHLLTAFTLVTGAIAAQNIGIGTTVPASKLHVKGSVDTTQLIIDANSTQSNTHPLIKLRNNSGTDLMWIHSDDSTNSFVGLNAGRVNNAPGSGVYNTFIGSYAGFSNTTGDYNSAIGSPVLSSNTTGYNNSAMGSFALYSNTTGFINSAIGALSLYSNTTGRGNCAIGYNSLEFNTTGIFNTAIGNNSLSQNTAGDFNSAVGLNALGFNTIGHHNVGIGNSALLNNMDGNYNTALGANADVSISFWGDATAIGANAIVNSNDKVVLGGPYPGIIVIGGYANWSNFSDGRFKENIREDVPGLSFINKLKPVTYQIDNQELVNHITHLMPDSIASRYKKTNAEYAALHQKRFTGFVAQEVEQAAKELGYDFDGINKPRNETDHYSVSYASFVMPLVKAVQEQQKMIQDMKKEIEELKKLIKPGK